MGLFNRRSNHELEALRGELRSMASRLDAADGEKENLAARVEQLTSALADERSVKEQLVGEVGVLSQRVQTVDDEERRIGDEVQGLRSRLDTPLSDPPAEPPPTGGDAAALDELRQRVEAVAEHVAIVDGRITTISTELANQLTELSNEVSTTAGGDVVDGALIEALQSGQERLANEQARYQIAFRKDLADLATRLQRPSSGR